MERTGKSSPPFTTTLDAHQMEPLVQRILNAERKRLFGSRPVFKPFKPAADLSALEKRLGVSLPTQLRNWLSSVGYGDIDEVLSFRTEWFSVIDRGELKGHVTFAQDDLGNVYSFSPTDGGIHFVSRTSPEFAFIAKDFATFLEEFERRDFQLGAWIDSLEVRRYSREI